MNAELPTAAFFAVDELGIIERLIDKMSQMTDDQIMLQRLSLAIDEIKHAAGYIAFVASRARAELQQQDRQREELIRSLKASIDARGCEEADRV